MKPTREEIQQEVRKERQEVRKERQEFSSRMNEETKYSTSYDLTTPDGREQFLHDNKHLILPTRLEPVLVKLEHIGETGKSVWYEVVYHDGEEWCSYSGSKTFSDGEKVLNWKYCKDLMETE